MVRERVRTGVEEGQGVVHEGRRRDVDSKALGRAAGEARAVAEVDERLRLRQVQRVVVDLPRAAASQLPLVTAPCVCDGIAMPTEPG
jgi:hypothetical protein